MSPHRITFPPEPQRRRFKLDAHAAIALVAGVATVIALLSIVLSLRASPRAVTTPVPAPTQLQATPLQPVAYEPGQLLADIRTEAFRAGYQAAIEREGCAPGIPPALGMPIPVHQLTRSQP